MPAFVILDLSIHNKEEFVEYQKLAPATVAAFDGKFIVRGGKTLSLEGDWHPERLVIIEFPSMEKAKEWSASEAYVAATAIRQRTAFTRMIIVEGV